MQVTNLKQKGKSEEYYVEIDNLQKGTLQLETIYKHKIKIGSEISGQEFLKLKEESDRLTCFSKALGYISSRLKTEKQMKEYLQGKGYSLSVVNEAIEKLKGYGYLNDEYYAKTFAEITSKNKGKLYVKQQLLFKGVKGEIIDNLMLSLDTDNEACQTIAEKWLKNKTLPLEKKDKEKLYRFLLSRGFEYDTIKSVLQSFNQDD